jgi:hypothetical protein
MRRDASLRRLLFSALRLPDDARAGSAPVTTNAVTSFDAAVTAPRVDDRLARASTTTRRDRRGVARRSTVPRARRV